MSNLPKTDGSDTIAGPGLENSAPIGPLLYNKN
jgi:hypothetical protein